LVIFFNTPSASGVTSQLVHVERIDMTSHWGFPDLKRVDGHLQSNESLPSWMESNANKNSRRITVFIKIGFVDYGAKDVSNSPKKRQKPAVALTPILYRRLL